MPKIDIYALPPKKSKASPRSEKSKRQSVSRPFNGGTMSESEFKQLLISALREASRWWKPKKECLNRAKVAPRRYKCELCGSVVDETYPAPEGKKRKIKGIQADHTVPCVPLAGWDSWDGFIKRMFVEADGFQAICHVCHSAKTKEENAVRKSNKAATTETNQSIF